MTEASIPFAERVGRANESVKKLVDPVLENGRNAAKNIGSSEGWQNVANKGRGILGHIKGNGYVYGAALAATGVAYLGYRAMSGNNQSRER